MSSLPPKGVNVEDFFGHFLRRVGETFACTFLCGVPVCVCVCSSPRPLTAPVLCSQRAESPPHPHMTPQARSRIRACKQLRDLTPGKNYPLKSAQFLYSFRLGRWGAKKPDVAAKKTTYGYLTDTSASFWTLWADALTKLPRIEEFANALYQIYSP